MHTIRALLELNGLAWKRYSSNRKMNSFFCIWFSKSWHTFC